MRLVCVRCHGVLREAGGPCMCDRCGFRFPVVGGIPILLAHPFRHLQAAKIELASSRLSFMREAARTAGLPATTGRAARKRAANAAKQRNADVIDGICAAPLRDIPLKQDPALLATVAATGWDLQRLVSYFCRDWAVGKRERLLNDLVLAGARDSPARGVAAVLGCGASRVVAELAEQFDEVLGIDLSVPGLLLADHLLTGGALALSPKHADWRSVPIEGIPAPPGVTLAAADAAALPLADQSVDFVVTQYLLDVVPDARLVACEINRVLRTGGIWLNLGLPFCVPGDPERWDARDLADFAASFGFALGTVREETIAHLDLSDLHDDTAGKLHRIAIATFAKVAPLTADPLAAALRAWHAGDRDILRGLALRPAAGVALSFSDVRRLKDGHERRHYEVRLDGRALFSRNDARASAVAERLWRALDGETPFGAIFTRELAGEVDEEEVVAFLRALSELGAFARAAR